MKSRDASHCLLTKIAFQRDLLQRYVPALVEFQDKEDILKNTEQNSYHNQYGDKRRPYQLSGYEKRLYEERNPILYVAMNTIPLKEREFSLIILVNDSLRMNVGKIISQISHGLFNLMYHTNNPNLKDDRAPRKINPLMKYWMRSGQAKIVIKCPEAEIMKRVGLAKLHNVPFEFVFDAGRTQVPNGSLTVALIGPWFVFVNKRISNGLRLM